MKNHPHKYTLDLLKIALDQLPETVPSDFVEAAFKDYEKFAENMAADPVMIEAKIAEVGKYSWSYRKAFIDLYEKYGKTREEEIFREKLTPDLREKYSGWIKTGHTIHDARTGAEFEKFFTSDEKFAIENATLEAHDEVEEETSMMVQGDKKEEYAERLKHWQERQNIINDNIKALRDLAAESPKWTGEILEKARLYEEGWSLVERDPDPYELDKELEYWRDSIQANEGNG
jgi:hypothetical protein